MSNTKGAGGAGVALALIIIVILIAVIYLAASGQLNSLLSTGSSKTSAPSTYTTTASFSGTILAGQQGAISFSYFNPFPEQVSAVVGLTATSSAFVTVNSASETITMPASMPLSSSSAFNVTCASSANNEQSGTEFTVNVEGYQQNTTTDVVTYPYNLSASKWQTLLSQQNPVPGFLSITANPEYIITYPSGSQNSVTIPITFTPNYYSGLIGGLGVTAGYQVMTSLTIVIDNPNGGIASAEAYYGNNYLPFTVAGTTLTLTIPNLNNAALTSSLPVTIVGNNIAASTQDLIYISATYGYQYSFPGPTVSCQ